MDEGLLGQLSGQREAVALAKEVMDEALDVVSDFVDNEPVSEDTETETVTGFHLRSLFRQGPKDFRLQSSLRKDWHQRTRGIILYNYDCKCIGPISKSQPRLDALGNQNDHLPHTLLKALEDCGAVKPRLVGSPFT